MQAVQPLAGVADERALRGARQRGGARRVPAFQVTQHDRLLEVARQPLQRGVDLLAQFRGGRCPHGFRLGRDLLAAGPALAGLEEVQGGVVRDLVASASDVTFLEGREVELKGIEGLQRLFAVDLVSAPTVS